MADCFWTDLLNVTQDCTPSEDDDVFFLLMPDGVSLSLENEGSTVRITLGTACGYPSGLIPMPPVVGMPGVELALDSSLRLTLQELKLGRSAGDLYSIYGWNGFNRGNNTSASQRLYYEEDVAAITEVPDPTYWVDPNAFQTGYMEISANLDAPAEAGNRFYFSAKFTHPDYPGVPIYLVGSSLVS